ncbi:hypothetical protein CEXT_666401 [Caerostris extrusa]|uniref:Uncharacterized protein n=1 Tax=Caerostris extrusa TaxID=172846 RepID=A0AAV4NZS9_CAEEX|nr:hypothetical protein CEXT_666401 [Caerostris extrusa]
MDSILNLLFSNLTIPARPKARVFRPSSRQQSRLKIVPLKFSCHRTISIFFFTVDPVVEMRSLLKVFTGCVKNSERVEMG